MTEVIEHLRSHRSHHPKHIVRPSDDPQAQRYGHIETHVSRRVARWMILNFVLLIAAVPIYQVVVELDQHMRPRVMDLLVRSSFPDRHDLKVYETSLRDTCITRLYFQPRVQEVVTGALAAGNSQVVVGRDGWLFYRPGIDYVMGVPFTSSEWKHKRAHDLIDSGEGDAPSVDPLATIVEFNRQCAACGAKLVLLPIPDKAMVQPGQLSRSFASSQPPNNSAYDQFIGRLRDAGVTVFDPTPQALAPGAARFLIHDTHWTPQWMQHVAIDLASTLRPIVGEVPGQPLQLRQQTISSLGDLAELLRLCPSQKLFEKQTVQIEQVLDGHGAPIRPDIHSPVLLMGDSFTNIFSDGEMGWGEGAGLGEHLSYSLGAPIDRISRNDAGAHATRQILADEMARGRDHLIGKKVVVWEFAMRELAVGIWKHIPIAPHPPTPIAQTSAGNGQFLSLAPGQMLRASGTIKAIAAPPVPGSAPYKDHIIAMQLVDLKDAQDKPIIGSAVVFIWSMRDQKLTEAARWRAGDRVTLTLQPWADVEQKYGTINRRELQDDALLMADPCWGEQATSP